MQRFLLRLAVVFTLLWTVSFVVIHTLPDKPKELPFTPSEALRPGQPRPDCRDSGYLQYPYDTQFCTLMVGERLIYISYGVSNRLIKRVSHSERFAIGDLILIWGQPMHTQTTGSSVYLVWPERAVWVFGRRFSPHTSNLLIIYTSEPLAGKRWFGFTRRTP